MFPYINPGHWIILYLITDLDLTCAGVVIHNVSIYTCADEAAAGVGAGGQWWTHVILAFIFIYCKNNKRSVHMIRYFQSGKQCLHTLKSYTFRSIKIDCYLHVSQRSYKIIQIIQQQCSVVFDIGIATTVLVVPVGIFHFMNFLV